MKLYTTFLLALLAFTGVGLAQEAVAVIEGPMNSIPPGSMVILDGSSSIGTPHWTLNEPRPAPEANCVVDSSGMKLYFATPALSGLYGFTLAVALENSVAVAQIVVTVGDPLPPPRLSISLRNDIISEGDNGGATSGIVSREIAGRVELPIALFSSDLTEVMVPPLVIIPEGEESAGFLIAAIDDDEEDGSQSVTISAETQGYERVSVDLTVTDDDGDDPPPPDSKWQILLFSEFDDRDDLSLEQNAILSGLRFKKEVEARGHKWIGSLDISSGPSSELKPWWEAVEGDPMPRICIAPRTGGGIRDYPLPETIDDVWELLGDPPK